MSADDLLTEFVRMKQRAEAAEAVIERVRETAQVMADCGSPGADQHAEGYANAGRVILTRLPEVTS